MTEISLPNIQKSPISIALAGAAIIITANVIYWKSWLILLYTISLFFAFFVALAIFNTFWFQRGRFERTEQTTRNLVITRERYRENIQLQLDLGFAQYWSTLGLSSYAVAFAIIAISIELFSVSHSLTSADQIIAAAVVIGVFGVICNFWAKHILNRARRRIETTKPVGFGNMKDTKNREVKEKQISQELRLSFVAIIVGLIGIGISLLTSSYTLVQPTSQVEKDLISLTLTALGILIFLLVIKLLRQNWRYIKGV